MSNSGESYRVPMEYSVPVGNSDPRVPLLNLSTVRKRMDSLQRFLSESVNSKTIIGNDQMDMVSAEISSAIHQIIVNGAALLASSQGPVPPAATKPPEQNPSDPPDLKISTQNSPLYCSLGNGKHLELNLKVEEREECELDCEIVELDAVELLAEHVHFCEICGKGFKRDANLRMHMRAHGNQFKTPEALARPDKSTDQSSSSQRKTRFSCPFEGCNRNRKHKKFRPLKSVICVRNHFKRSHCPKMYSCNRCNKKSFSVVADLKSHLKHCGESRWKCSCGTNFSRKDKLFGHMALFEGHMPAVMGEEDEKSRGLAVMVEEDEEEEVTIKGEQLGLGDNYPDNGFFEGLLDGFGSIEGFNLQEMLGSPTNGWGSGLEEFWGVGQR